MTMQGSTDGTALDRNFYTVFDWMVDPAGLGLKAASAELSVYAKVYSMSHHSAYGYYVTQDQLALDLYISRRSVQRALDSLIKAGLIGCNELFRNPREAAGMRGPRSYYVIQEKINEAIEATTPLSYSRGNALEDNFSFQQPAGQADAPTCHNVPVENLNFQQCADQADAPTCHNDASECRTDVTTCHIDASSCHNDASECRISSTCENVRKAQDTSDLSSSSNDIYINKNNNKNNNYYYFSSFNDELEEQRCSNADSSDSGKMNNNEVSCPSEAVSLTRSIIESSPKYIDDAYAEKTLAAIKNVLSEGIGAEEVFAAWNAYLENLMEQNADGGSAAFKRYSMFPLNWLNRADGFKFYLKQIRDLRKKAESESEQESNTDEAGSQNVLRNAADDLARKYCLKGINTTSGRIWTFMDDFGFGQIAPRVTNCRDALRFMCGEKGIEVPADIDEMTEV